MASFSRGACISVTRDTMVFPLDDVCPRWLRKGTLLLVASMDGDSIHFVGVNEHGQMFHGHDYWDCYDTVLHPGYSVGQSVSVEEEPQSPQEGREPSDAVTGA